MFKKIASFAYNSAIKVLSLFKLQKILEDIRFSYTQKVPPHLHIELNNNCNLNCIMCPRKKLTRKIGNMPFSLYKKIIDEAAKLKIPDIKLFLFGEPLLYPKLIEAIKYAKNKGLKQVSFDTNGILLSKNKAKELINSGIDRIDFSMEGIDKKTYESIRKGGNFEKLTKNIIYLTKLRDSLKIKKPKKPKIVISTLVMKQTKNQIKNFVKKWKNIVDHVNVGQCMTYGGIKDYSLKKKRLSKHPCYQLWDKLLVLCDGSVIVCCNDFNGELKIGNMKNTTIKGLWRCEKLTNMRKIHRNRQFYKIPLCASCDEIFYKRPV